MASSLTGVAIQYSGEGSCLHFKSESFDGERMRMELIPQLLALFNDPENLAAYGSTKPKTLDVIARIVQRDVERPVFTGFAMVTKTGELLGRVAMGTGYAPSRHFDGEGSYVAAPTADEEGEVPAEIQIGDFVTSDVALLEKTGKTRRALYEEMIETIIQVAKDAIGRGYTQNGQPVSRITITVINPEKSDLEGSALEDLQMRNSIISGIFGKHAGILSPVDPRNYSAHERFVYAYEVGALVAGSL
jgi:hypothetical protein